MDSLAGESKKRLSSGTVSPLILHSLDPNINNLTTDTPQISPNICNDHNQLQSLSLLDVPENNGHKGIQLLDDGENLKIKDEKEFLKALNLKAGNKVKVISIFGNTGEGKSYTLNKIFFKGKEVFKTSSSQTSCTLGVWAKYDPNLNVICLDTEGLLGITKKEEQRTRLLLKVLAVSDIIIYRTRAERLQRDLYTFLGGASHIYKEHFSVALQKILSGSEGEKINIGLGPGVIIFHETRNTDTLDASNYVLSENQSPEDILRQHFAELGLNCDAFSFLKYIGVKTSVNSDTSFDRLKSEIHKQLEAKEIRSARDAKYVHIILKNLNEKFQSPIDSVSHLQYLSQFFTCPDKCQSCKAGCILSMGHKDEKQPHVSDSACKFQHQYQNCVYLCKKCYNDGNKIIVKPSYQTSRDSSWSSYFNYVWSGYVIECKKCGEIYRSRQHWYGNKNPEDTAVRLEVVHIWPGEGMLFGTYNAAQKVVDNMSVITDAVTSVSSQPAKMITDWVNDKIAPSYWRPNSEITACFNCRISFVPSGQNRIVPSKHHCRGCGEGFCENCSSNQCAVLHRGWTDPVRVCDLCFQQLDGRGQSIMAGVSGDESTEVRARYITETLVSPITAVKSVYDMSKGFIKETARPSYWTPDSECVQCVLCKNSFGPLLPLHHCRDCGKGVCDHCSNSRKAVPLKGWDMPVRVCDACR